MIVDNKTIKDEQNSNTTATRETCEEREAMMGLCNPYAEIGKHMSQKFVFIFYDQFSKFF